MLQVTINFEECTTVMHTKCHGKQNIQKSHMDIKWINKQKKTGHPDLN